MLRIAIENLKDMRRRHVKRQAIQGTCKLLFVPEYIQKATTKFKDEKVLIQFFLWQTDFSLLEGRVEMARL
jgi:hypothetical protein